MSNDVDVIKKNFRAKLWSQISKETDDLLYKFTDEEINKIASIRRAAQEFVPYTAGQFVIYVEELPELGLVPFVALSPQYMRPTSLQQDKAQLYTIIAINLNANVFDVLLTSDKEQLAVGSYSFSGFNINPVDVSQVGNGETSEEGDARIKNKSLLRAAAFEAFNAQMLPTTAEKTGPTELFDLEHRDPKSPWGILNDSNRLIAELEKPENADILAAFNAQIDWSKGISASAIESGIPDELKERWSVISQAIDAPSGHSGASWGTMFFAAMARIHGKLDTHGVTTAPVTISSD